MGGLLRKWMVLAGLVLAGLSAGCSPNSAGGGVAGERTAGEPGSEPGPGRMTIRITAEGGQTGTEGGCFAGGKTELDFSAEDLHAWVAGSHQTTIAYRPWRPPANLWRPPAETGDTVRDLSVSVRFLGEPQTVLACGGAQLRQQVEVTLAFDQPALDLIFETRLSAVTADYAWVVLELDPSVIEALQLPGVERPANVSTLILGFDPRGPRGMMYLNRPCVDGRSAGQVGGVVVFPSSARCEEPHAPEIDLDQAVYGVRPREVLQTALQELSALGPALPLQWDDGTSTTLSITVEDEPTYVCGSLAPLLGLTDVAYHEAPTRVRVTTGDGRVDLRLSANLAWTVLPDAPDRYATAGWDGSWGLGAESDFPPAELPDAGAISGVMLPDDGLIRVDFFVGMDEWHLNILAWAPGMCSGEPRSIAMGNRPDSTP